MAVEEVCSKVTAVPTPLCEDLLKTAWQHLAEKCPKTSAVEASIPIPPAVKDFVCKELEDATIEGSAVDEVCSKVTAIPTPICQEAVKSAWEYLEEKCLKQWSLLEPISKIIEDLLCEALENGTEVQKIPAEVCSKLSEKFKFVHEEVCEEMIRNDWADFVEKCPKKKTLTLFGPIPQIIEEVMCAELESGTEESKIATEVCSKVTKIITGVPEEACEDAVKGAWEAVAKKCPKKETTLPAPIEKFVENYFCEELKNGMEETQIPQVVCDKVTSVVKFLPGFVCRDFVKDSWKELEAKCPKVLYLPAPVEQAIKALEEVLCRQLENVSDLPKATSEACALVHDHFRDFPQEACADVALMIAEKAVSVCDSKKVSVLV
eukprot:CAMPEP_0117622924 /NCGR_PEP_ID=MMETSP0784-20121206/88388_1 /TAXON_ID=39447 /ORGANISM="" /LENGTH=376 /DNA_ID=CAMNT_0005426871 /DNA_START=184 /DNA_END=1314 /DNA_ORIENTATION=+